MKKFELERFIRDVPDFPKPGILFKDITPLLSSADALRHCCTALAEAVAAFQPTKIAAIESRGFIFGSVVATELDCGFIPIRKPGKLPWKTVRHDYTLEYGSGTLEIHEDALTSEDRVVLIDDLLATGGTAGAAAALVRGSGANLVGAAFVIELSFLSGRTKLKSVPVHSLLTY